MVAVDPDVLAVAACQRRLPDIDVRVAVTEALPFSDGEFDVVLAQLVVSFMSDAHAGVTEMCRVAGRGGVVAACVWDFAGGMTLLRTFWDAALALDADAASRDQAKTRPFATPNGLSALWHSARLNNVSTEELRAGAGYSGFEDLWGAIGRARRVAGRLLRRARRSASPGASPRGAASTRFTGWVVPADGARVVRSRLRLARRRERTPRNAGFPSRLLRSAHLDTLEVAVRGTHVAAFR